MFSPETTVVLRAVLDEVCESASLYETGVRAHFGGLLLTLALAHFGIDVSAGM